MYFLIFPFLSDLILVYWMSRDAGFQHFYQNYIFTVIFATQVKIIKFLIWPDKLSHALRIVFLFALKVDVWCSIHCVRFNVLCELRSVI